MRPAAENEKTFIAGPAPAISTPPMLPAILIVAATCIAFFPALQNGFVNWDDDRILTNNPHYRGLGWSELKWMFTTLQMGHYQPLTWLSFALDYLLWGMNPFGYHLTNLLLHAANAMLFYFVATRLLSLRDAAPREKPAVAFAAGFAALFFALHPLRVESVAWATERRDVLSGFFFLLTILGYLRAATDENDRARRLGAAVGFYLLSLLSKASGMALPLVLLGCDVYPLKRLGGRPRAWLGSGGRKIWLEKAPFFALAVSFGIVALIAQHQARILRTLEQHGLQARLSQTAYGLAFYLWKTVVPENLSPLYQLPPRFEALDGRFIAGAIATVSLTISFYLLRRRWPAGLAAWVYYGVMLAPVLGPAQSGPQLVADRYSYLPCLSWAVLAGAGLQYFLRPRPGQRRPPLVPLSIAVAVLAVLGISTWQQTRVWRDSETLWSRALAVDQSSSLAHHNLGMALAERGAFDEAIPHYRRALQINPEYVLAYNNLAVALLARGELGEATAALRRAVEIDPAYAMAESNLGIALTREGNVERAAEHFERAVALNPASAPAHYNLGLALAMLGKSEGALRQFYQALEIDPDYAEAHYHTGAVLAGNGRAAQAVAHFRRALEIRPEFPAARQALRQALGAANNE
jgi:protein O-mannosyl-transferase